MRINLSIAYWGLLLISLISSCLLFIIVASEATKLNDKAADAPGQQYVENTNKNYKETTVIKEENNENFDYVDVTKIDSGQLSENVDVNNEKHENQGNVAASADVADAAADQGSIDQTETDVDDKPESLPDLPANPAVITLGDKAPDILIENAAIDDIDDESIIINTLTDSLVNKSEEALKMDHIQIPGSLTLSETKSSIKKEVVLPHESPPQDGNLNEIDDSASIIGSDTSQESKDSQILSDELAQHHVDTPIVVATPQTGTTSDGTQTPSPEVNLTVEENPIPVFSEWAQKQMEEAEKKLEKQTVNSSSMRKNATSGSKPQLMKLRAKNYASPDCGAKIIASNSEAQNTGAVLSALKDEYMLSPCTNRIWFVVELCEAIQAEKVELANFELFSSSPKNFTVSVNNRFPTREWSNVGRFVAEDQRNIQSFDLFPHLFGKFVRVDIHSHYNSEHFCPISLFRVYGTSEFEAFETENRPPVDDVDDFEEDDALDQGAVKNENTLFKSASDAVMSIVKKAAEVLVKTNSNKTETNINQNHSTHTKQEYCFTPRYPFTCEKCKIASSFGGPSNSNSNIEDFVTNVNYLLSCKYNLLTSLLSIDFLKNHITSSRICANNFNLNVNNYENLDCNSGSSTNSRNSNYKINQLNGDNNVNFDDRSSYLLGSFSLQYLAAMCHILATLSKTNKSSKYSTASPDNALNLTIDQKPSAKFANVENLGTKTPTVSGIDNEILKDRGPKLTIVNKPYTQQPELTQQIYDRDRPDVENDIKFDNLNEYNSEDAHKRSANTGKDGATGAEYDDFQTQIKSPPTTNEIGDSKDDSNISSMENVNIFNIVEDATLPEYTPEPTLSPSQPTIPSSIPEEIDTTTKTIAADSGDRDSVARTDEAASSTVPSATKTKDIEVETNTWDNLDNIILAETVETGSHIDSNLPSQATPQKVHSESVFIRLSNRVKALERNMSLSGQYLEELSRRYKKQVEELQHSFAKTLSAIEEQNRRAIEREELLFDENRKLRADLDEVSNRLNSWITLVICLGTFVVLQIIFAWILITSARRQQFKLLKRFEDNSLLRRRKSNVPRPLLRRRSVEGVSGHPSPVHKPRRPSEEAMQICGSYKNLLIEPTSTERSEEAVKDDESNDTLSEMTRKRSYRKKKISQGKKTDSIIEALIKIKNYEDISPNSSASGLSIPADGQLILDEDYESYTPGSDLAYNEYMPEGPSGKQSQINGKSTNGVPTKASKKTSKLRRLSSPGFLKSPFGRSTSSSGGKKLAHGPTGWEWYRLKKTDTSPTSSQERPIMKKSKSVSPEVKIKINGIGSNSQNSSLSEFIPPPSNDGSSDSIRTSTTNSILSNEIDQFETDNLLMATKLTEETVISGICVC